MTDTFSTSEVFQMAEEIERNGVRFYKEGAQAVDNKNVKNLMLDLAEKERKHEAIFHDLRKQLCAREETHVIDTDGQVGLFVKLMADSHVFNLDEDVSKTLASVQSVKSMLKLAIGFEKDTIVFFTALKEMVKENNRPKVQRLIQEEFEHVRDLHDALQALQDSD